MAELESNVRDVVLFYVVLASTLLTSIEKEPFQAALEFVDQALEDPELREITFTELTLQAVLEDKSPAGAIRLAIKYATAALDLLEGSAKSGPELLS